MTQKYSSPLRKITVLVLALLVIVVVGLGAYLLYSKVINPSANTAVKTMHPEYLNFSGNYVFGVPKSYTVDEQSLPGVQLVYSGKLTAKTMEEVYDRGGISIQAIGDLSDHSGKAFKDYVNKKYLPELKKNLSTNAVEVTFGKSGGQDVARLSVNKDNKSVRFIYLKGGQHPVVVVAKQQTDAFKDIEQTLVDIEKNDINSQTESIKKAIQSTTQLLKSQKAKDIFASAAPELRAKNTEAELGKVMKDASPFIDGDIVVNGVIYAPDEFTTSVSFTRLDKEGQEPGAGVLNYKKIDGQWKLNVLSLPAPK